MYTILMILALLVSILLIAVVLIQPGKGDVAAGLGTIGGQFGSMIGMRRAADFIIKTTIVLAAVLLVLSYAVNKFFLPSGGTEERPRVEGAEVPAEAPAPPPPAVPAQK
ncbi:MAG: preprotein translocase subunit SecG [Bacteroidota bacterium]|nr:preprotein translocase subunit SecG [Candidatus Kapabacteria bacterium]MCS7302046.1 preprotein translocase subunit SecG [Candidatus Kapabacteria bacterium]MCX7936846.1 preprotein translocase subunit SecG [Chlorobiota bacterium]MDW8074565.1 preprotein translocase subunit SecG [Bacteroidota bacterium]MDW8270959.1 preprotein translocase subunit SecG [Bacteroidota bacterium]